MGWDIRSLSSITCMAIFPCLAAIFKKGNKLYDFLIASPETKESKIGHLQLRICSSRSSL